MKKIIATLLALSLVLSMAVFVSAADKATLTGNDVSTKAGTVVGVPLYLKDIQKLIGTGTTNGRLCGYELNYTIDAAFVGKVAILDVVDLPSSEKPNPFGAPQIIEWGATVDSVKLLIEDSTNLGIDITTLGTDFKLGTIAVQVDASVPEGSEIEISLSLVVVPDNMSAYYNDSIEVAPFTVTVVGDEPATSTPSETETSTPSTGDTSTPSTGSTSTSSVKPGTSTPSAKPATTTKAPTGTTTPKTGDAGVLAVAGLMALAAGAAFVTMKKR